MTTSFRRASHVAVSAFVCALVGLGVQTLLPAHVIADGRGVIGMVIGVVALLLALVLGLLIWTSYGVFANQQAESQTLSITTLQLDYLLEQYGPESGPGRMGIREAVRRSRDRYFSGRSPDTELSFALAREKLHSIDSFFSALHPEDEERKQLLSAAKPLATSIVATQLLMSRQLVNPVPKLLIVMVQIWTSLLFLGYGFMGNVTVVAAVANACGSFAIASAIFLIIEFSEPYSGIFRISPEAIDKVIAELETNAPKI